MKQVKWARFGTMLSATLALAVTSSSGFAQANRGAPRLDQAMAGVQACLIYAQENGFPVAIVVKDSGDQLITAARGDGVAIGNLEGAQDKASSSARTQAPTSIFAKFAFDDETGAPNAMAFTEVFSLHAGGVPIVTEDGTFVGAVGVSGSTAENDEGCANAAVAAILADWGE